MVDEPPITGMWELVTGPPLSEQATRHAIRVLGRLSGSLHADDDVGRIEITIGPRTWRYRQLPALLLTMPEGGPMTAILGPQEASDSPRVAS